MFELLKLKLAHKTLQLTDTLNNGAIIRCGKIASVKDNNNFDD